MGWICTTVAHCKGSHWPLLPTLSPPPSHGCPSESSAFRRKAPCPRYGTAPASLRRSTRAPTWLHPAGEEMEGAGEGREEKGEGRSVEGGENWRQLGSGLEKSKRKQAPGKCL